MAEEVYVEEHANRVKRRRSWKSAECVRGTTDGLSLSTKYCTDSVLLSSQN